MNPSRSKNSDDAAHCGSAPGEVDRSPRASRESLCLHDLFIQQARRTPDAVAIVAGRQEISYREVEARSNFLARRLMDSGAGPEKRVGILLRRSPALITSLLGVLKSGACYLSLDPAIPRARLELIAREAGVCLLVTQFDLEETASGIGVECLLVEEHPGDCDDPPSVRVHPDNAAYLIFTSGSSGRPKGVVVPHRAIVNYVDWAVRTLPTTEGRGSPIITSTAMDLGFTNLFPPLLSGGTLQLLSELDTLDSLAAELCDWGDFGVLKLTPSHLRALGSLGVAERCRQAARALIVGGEQLRREDILPWRSRARRILNHYGPTEAAVGCCTWEVDWKGLSPGAIPIGKAIPQLRLSLLDKRFRPTAEGESGELFIAGAGLARGYAENPRRTAASFLPDPFGSPGDRIYRTGDIASRNSNGDFVFEGRADDQVKIRGFRVEPEEAAAALLQHQQVESAAVVARGSSREPFLTAYFVAPTAKLNAQDLRLFLKGLLPDHLIPSRFVRLDELPLSPNGKLDRKALPEPRRERDRGDLAAARNPQEQAVAQVWAKVLNLDRVGIDEDFFALGGHSLLATQVIARLSQAFDSEIPLRLLFESPTIRTLTARLEERQSDAVPAIGPASRRGPLPLSHAQQRMWFLSRLVAGNPFYNVPTAWRLQGRLNRGALSHALNAIVDRHAVLRSKIELRNGRPVQSAAEGVRISLPMTDLQGLPQHLRRREVDRLSRQEAVRPFDLGCPPLCRALLIRIAERDWGLLLTLHHIASDGWSTWLFRQELALLYESGCRGESASLPSLPFQYADFAVWQRERLQGRRLQTQLAYWTRRLQGVESLELPIDKPRPPVQAFRGASLGYRLPADLSEGMTSLGRQAEATLYMVLLAAFATLLHRITGQRDIVVGSPIANRSQPETEKLIGYFANTLAMRTNFDGDPAFAEILQQVRDDAMGAYEHQDFPFERLVEHLQPERSLSRNPIIQVVLALQNTPSPHLQLPDLRISRLVKERRTVRFDLEFLLRETREGIRGVLRYDRDLFARRTIERLGFHFTRLIRGIVDDPARKVSRIPLISDAERRRILEVWSGQSAPQPRTPIVHRMFQRQVRISGSSPAAEFFGRSMSYRELEKASLRIAGALRSVGIGAESRVGVFLRRDLEMIPAFLGVLMAGGAYVPLDPQYPAGRLRFMIEDSRCEAVLARSSDLEGLSEVKIPILELDGIDDRVGAAPSVAPCQADRIAYVMYTSGSTGRPKGVAVTHRAIVRLVRNADFVQIQARDRVAQTSNMSFDAATFEIWGALLNGACLVGFSREEKLDPGALLQRIRSSSVSTMFLTTSLFNQIARQRPDVFRGLRHLVIGGEEASPIRSEEVLRHGAPTRLINGYGPTETTTFACWHRVRPEDVREGARIPIGRPLANTRAYVADASLNCAPAGVVGELLIGGIGLARGYIGDPRTTAERFIPCAFGPSGTRLYRTGDFARFRANGLIDFLGRMDSQVKVRGFRVEPGEVESAMMTCPGVRQGAVIPFRDAAGTHSLAGYYVCDADLSQQLRKHLSSRLPDHAIPAFLVRLESLPLTPNGKLDRRALPSPQTKSDQLKQPKEPRDETQRRLAQIWCEALGLQSVGIRDDFFRLGGHSLLLMHVASRIQSDFGIELSLKTLFEKTTIEGLAARIAASEARPRLAVSTPRDLTFPLSCTQRRFWFLHRLDPSADPYNMPYGWSLRGRLRYGALRSALEGVTRRHHVLRARFLETEAGPLQIFDEAFVQLPMVDLTGLTDESRRSESAALSRREAQNPFDLQKGRLIRATLMKLDEELHQFLLTQHHIVSDGLSMPILLSDTKAFYQAALHSQAPHLPDLEAQYRDFVAWQESWLLSKQADQQLDFWKKQLADAAPLNLPTDHPRSHGPVSGRRHSELLLQDSEAEGLRILAKECRATLFMTVLAGLMALLHRYSGQSDVTIGTPISGRTLPEFEPLVGCFINTIALRSQLRGDPSFREFLGRVRDTSIQAFTNERLPFERIVESLNPERGSGRNPIYQVLFTLRTAPRAKLELQGLQASPFESSVRRARMDLRVSCEEDELGLRANLECDGRLFKQRTIEQLSNQFEQLLRSVAADPSQPISRLATMNAQELLELLTRCRGRRAPLPVRPVLHELFADQASARPQATALRFSDGEFSYASLDALSDAVADRLNRLDLAPESRVGVCLPRGALWVTALIGVLKAGCAYVPLDPSLPADMLKYMISASQCSALLASSEASFPVAELPRIDPARPAFHSDPSRPPAKAYPDGLAYMTFTSGSTGCPKGVGVTHRAVVRLVHGTDYQQIRPFDRVGQASDSSFDAATFEIWGALLNGACLVGLDIAETISPAALERKLRRERVGVLFLTTTLFNQIAARRPETLHPLRTLLVGGEAVDPSRVSRFLASQPPGRLLNVYGPTECTTFATWHQVRQVPADARTVPIGTPITNTDAYLLDANFGPVGQGAWGEIFLGGPGLARGYLNSPSLTAERFLPSLFGSSGDRLYRTGDRARLNGDGEIEFGGRIDDEVKIRGFRVEPAEIEAVLGGFPGLSRVAVLPERDPLGTQRLVAYIEDAKEIPAARRLRDFLSQRLPEYMIPARWVSLARIPMTASGKTDRRRLPAVRTRTLPLESSGAPKNTLQRRLLELWVEVLEDDTIGIEDDFFEAGGHSLLAAALLARIRLRMNLDLPLRALFDAPTVESLSRRIETAAPKRAQPIGRADRPSRVPLSSAQSRLWFLDRLDPGRASYNLPIAWRINGQLNVRALAWAIDEITRRHEVLRTSFPSCDGVPYQSIQPHPGRRLGRIDLTALEPGVGRREGDRLTAQEIQRPFSLAAGPLVRVNCLHLGDEEHLLLVVKHHIVSDGWSLGVFVWELTSLYQAFAAGEPSPLLELPIQYADYAIWQRERTSGEALERLLRLWTEKLKGAEEFDLPTDFPRRADRAPRGGRVKGVVPAETALRLRKLARDHRSTLYAAMLTVLQVLVHRWTGKTDVVFGSPVANRGHPELEGLIGLFVNTLPMRLDLSGDPPFAQLLKRSSRQVVEAFANQEVPFEKLVERLGIRRRPDRNPIFQILFALQNLPKASARKTDASFERVDLSVRSLHFDLAFYLREAAQDTIAGTLVFDESLFRRSTAERLVAHFCALCASIAQNPGRRLSGLSLLSGKEARQLTLEWNRTAIRYSEACVHRLFEEQARREPKRHAVRFQGAALDYRQIDQWANHVSHRLAALGAGPESRVGLLMNRSPAQIASLLGILKAGSAFVPLDQANPPLRLRRVIKDAQAEFIVSDGRPLDWIDDDAVQVVEVNAPAREESPPRSSLDPSNAAYVIFTSGSSGRPKGVVVPHRAISNYAQWCRGRMPTACRRGSIVHSSLDFDLGLTALLPPLLSGGCLELAPESESLQAVGQALRSGSAGLVKLTPSHLRALNPVADRDAAATPLSAIVIGGESLHADDVSPWAGRARMILNHYGPTEAAVGCCVSEVPRSSPPHVGKAIPIGRPIANARLYVLDGFLQPVPVGFPGELCIAGRGLARGYAQRPALTAASFVPDPFSRGGRLYRTGDRAMRQPGGDLLFLGRIDHQIKIRGHRVEPQEIASLLRQRQDIREAAVVLRETASGRSVLAAYMVASQDPAPESDLKSFLRQRLPSFMVPDSFSFLSELPMTPNGKLDSRSLPTPVLESQGAQASEDPFEAKLCLLFSSLLSMDSVRPEEDFFELGGHSLMAAQLISRVRREFEAALTLRDLFEAPTPRQLTTRILQASRQAPPPILPRDRGTQSPLSFAQERVWFLEALRPGRLDYNLPQTWLVQGELDHRALESALRAVVARHEPLRAVFPLVDGAPVQKALPESRLPLHRVDLTHLDSGAADSQIAVVSRAFDQLPFDLSQEPPLRSYLVRMSPNRHVFKLVLHHIAGDGWSSGLLRRELAALYEAFLDGRGSPLPPLRIRYSDFSQWQREWLQGDVLQRQLEFWTDLLPKNPALNLPTDRPHSAVKRFAGKNMRFRLPISLLKALKELSLAHGATLYMTLLTAFQTLLFRYTRQDRIVVGTPIANRHYGDNENLIGFFANTLSIPGDLSGNPTFSELLQQIRETCLGAFAHQDLPFERLVEHLQPNRELGRNPLVQVMFALQNAPAEPLGLARLQVEPLNLRLRSTPFDLEMSFREGAEGLRGVVIYDSDLFRRGTVQGMIRHYQRILESIALDSDRPILSLDLLGEGEAQQLLSLGAGRRTASCRQCLHDLFLDQARRTPRNPALACGETQLDYGRLAQAATRLSRRIRRAGIGRGDVVAICLPRGAFLLEAMLGILQAGAAYLPMDPAFPRHRLAGIVEDAQPRLILTTAKLQGDLAELAPCWPLDAPHGLEEGESPPQPTAPQETAYLIYTSGSSGEPKGVEVPHSAAVNFLRSMRDRLSLSPRDRLLAVTTVSFDISLLELLLPLTIGALVIIAEDSQVSDPQLLSQCLDRSGATVLQGTPATWRFLLEGGWKGSDQLQALCGGEALPGELADRLAARCRTLMNLYGPTEATVWVTAGRARRDGAAHALITDPLDNVGLCVLDSELRLAPHGVPGELCLSGACLARGYRGRSSLTARRFVPHPFGAPGERLYRTGDLVRSREDGSIEFLGRMDRQVKVRGFRIEAGEVESALVQHPDVEEAAVLAQEDDLLAFIRSRKGRPAPTQPDAAQWLRRRLPEYMIPSVLHSISRIPLTPSGKVDQRALEALRPRDVVRTAAFIAPQDGIESDLAGLWRELLRVDRVSAADDFFGLGGHSLLVVRLLSRVQDRLAPRISLDDLYSHPVLREMARAVEKAGPWPSAALPPIKHSPRRREFPLSLPQERLWNLQRRGPEDANLVQLIRRIRGRLRPDAIERALGEVIGRHQILRTVFRDTPQGPRQVTLDPTPFRLDLIDLSRLQRQSPSSEAIIASDKIRPLDLGSSPLLRATILRLGERDHVLMLTAPHIVVDGWSMGVLFKEFAEHYRALRQGVRAALPQLDVQYADFALWQREHLSGAKATQDLAYWRSKLQASKALFDPPRRPTYLAGRLQLDLGQDLTARLKALALREGNTLFVLMLAAFKVALRQQTGRRDITVGAASFNRPKPELEPLIGLFSNNLALRSRIRDGLSFRAYLAEVQRTVLDAFSHQDLPYGVLLEELRKTRNLQKYPIFQAMLQLRVARSRTLNLDAAAVAESLPAPRDSGGRTWFALTLNLRDTGRVVDGHLVFRKDILSPVSAQALMETFSRILRCASTDPDASLRELAATRKPVGPVESGS